MSASSNNIAVSVRGLNKSYSIAHQAAKHSTFTEVLLDRARHPFRREERETFDALKDVSFDIKKGEVVGIIGRNGAGKSTLLKILSRITEPTSGEIDLYGRVGSLLEVGTGFHPELTGRENIFLNGAILGMSRAEIRKQFEAIVDFSGVEKFLDTPVKRYSSGMYVRLAFAVAAHLRSEILIVDEVLAVGDSDFQKKCLGKMQNVASSGRTVLFVSHNMAAVQTLCSSGIVLKNGAVDAFGAIDECVEAYAGNHPRGDYWHAERPSDVGLAFTRIRASLLGEQPEITLELDLTLEGPTPLGNVFLAADVSDSTGVVVMQAIPEARGSVQAGRRGHELVVSVDLPPLIPGRYLVSLWVGPNHATTIHHVKECVAFEILDSPIAGRAFPHTRDHGCVVPKSRCELRSETQAIQICRTGARNTVPIS